MMIEILMKAVWKTMKMIPLKVHLGKDQAKEIKIKNNHNLL